MNPQIYHEKTEIRKVHFFLPFFMPKSLPLPVNFTNMKNILLLLSLIFCQMMIGQKAFPDAWIGKWQGDVIIYNATGIAQTVPMELHIAAGDSAQQWKWTMLYLPKDKPKDERPYVLKIKDLAKSHYIMDEKNSILLDAYYYGGVFYSSFEVQGSQLLATYRMQGKHLMMEITFGKSEAINTTGGTSEDVPPVKSFAIGGMQRAILKRMK